MGPLLRDGAQPSAARIVISTNIILQRCPVWSIHLQGNHSVLVSRSSPVFVAKMNLWVLFIVLLQWQLSSAGLPAMQSHSRGLHALLHLLPLSISAFHQPCTLFCPPVSLPKQTIHVYFIFTQRHKTCYF